VDSNESRREYSETESPLARLNLSRAVDMATAALSERSVPRNGLAIWDSSHTDDFDARPPEHR
jgi:hypothetical protein